MLNSSYQEIRRWQIRTSKLRLTSAEFECILLEGSEHLAVTASDMSEEDVFGKYHRF